MAGLQLQFRSQPNGFALAFAAAQIEFDVRSQRHRPRGIGRFRGKGNGGFADVNGPVFPAAGKTGGKRQRIFRLFQVFRVVKTDFRLHVLCAVNGGYEVPVGNQKMQQSFRFLLFVDAALNGDQPDFEVVLGLPFADSAVAGQRIVVKNVIKQDFF